MRTFSKSYSRTEKRRAYVSSWNRAKRSKPGVKALLAQKAKEKRDRFPTVKLKQNISRTIRYHLSCRNLDTRPPYLGCSIGDYIPYLESMFSPGMTWKNYGSFWVIDHDKPVSAFNLLSESGRKKCFHYSNTQPLERIANIKKGGAFAVNFSNRPLPKNT